MEKHSSSPLVQYFLNLLLQDGFGCASLDAELLRAPATTGNFSVPAGSV